MLAIEGFLKIILRVSSVCIGCNNLYIRTIFCYNFKSRGGSRGRSRSRTRNNPNTIQIKSGSSIGESLNPLPYFVPFLFPTLQYRLDLIKYRIWNPH